jgi:hypothetical protein
LLAGRPSRTRRPAQKTTTIGGVSYTQATAYDSAGRPRTLTYP